MATYLKVSVVWVRVAMVAFTLLGGAGLFAYLFWWLTIPAGDPLQAGVLGRPAVVQRLARRPNSLGVPQALAAGLRRREVLGGIALLTAAALLLAAQYGWDWRHSWIPPVLLALVGLGVSWSQLDLSGAGQVGTRQIILRVAGGLILVVAGVLLFFGPGRPTWELLQTGISVVVVLLGAGLVIAPWWVHLQRRLGDARAAQEREAERADIAAHLHDSVLQTLALIRANAADPDAVSRLARTQERELRNWLYADRLEADASLATQLKELAAHVEDGKIGKVAGAQAPIDVVIVGDCEPGPETPTVLAATREALVNAVAHGTPPISLYCEVSDDAIEVFVRDRGAGFDLAAVPADRMGVRESIVGRMERRGGSAEIVSRPNWGTEVRLKSPR